MALIKFFKVPKHQQFEYKTRYWDPRKEELYERLKRADERKGNDIEATKARIAGSFRGKGYFSDSSYRRRQAQRSNMILVAVVIVLLFFCYLFLTVYLPKIVRAVEGSGQL